MLLPDGHSAALGVDGREVVGKRVDAIDGAFLKRVLLNFVVVAVFLLLYCELLDCRQVAMFLVLLVHLPLGGLPAFALLTITEHLLLEGCQINLLQALGDLLFFLLLCFPASWLEIDEVEISWVLAGESFGHARWRIVFLARRRSSHFLLFPLYFIEDLCDNFM